MIVVFEKGYLRDLYEKGHSKDKKYRFQPDIVRRYKRCISLMREVPNLPSLAKYKGLNLEKLRGDKAGLFSIRVNDQYRIEFKAHEVKNEIYTTICNIIELSKHYEK